LVDSPDYYSFPDAGLNCELYVEKSDENVLYAGNVRKSAFYEGVDNHRFIHTLHRNAALTFFNLPFTFSPVDG
jgi:hypothetical protein